MLAVPFSLVGAFWTFYLLHYNLSVAVWVGIIALAGLDAETGVVMLLYLDLAYDEWKKKGLMRNVADLRDAIYHGAVKRVRPKAMTACVIIAGLAPILWSHGAGADVMKRIATPMVGGVDHLHHHGTGGLSRRSFTSGAPEPLGIVVLTNLSELVEDGEAASRNISDSKLVLIAVEEQTRLNVGARTSCSCRRG